MPLLMPPPPVPKSRHFKLYLTTNTDLFSDNFKAVFVDKHGKEKNYDVQLQNYFTGHVVGEWMTALSDNVLLYYTMIGNPTT